MSSKLIKQSVLKIKNLKANISAVFGGIFVLPGLIGALGLCCSPAVIAFFAIFGISSMLLVRYSSIFLIIGGVFIGISVVLYLKSRGCEVKKSEYRKI